jgi:hypothetical protein
MINIRTTSGTTGPFFNGQLAHQLHLVVAEAEEEIATAGADHLRHDLGAPPFKHPTGWYKSHITPKLLGPFWVIQDSGVVYGPWLAGTSSRNRTSRFKGYQHWRRAIAYVRRIAQPATDKVVARALRRAG